MFCQKRTLICCERCLRTFYMSQERFTRFFTCRGKVDPRASSGKFLRVKSRYPESFRFFCLWIMGILALSGLIVLSLDLLSGITLGRRSQSNFNTLGLLCSRSSSSSSSLKSSKKSVSQELLEESCNIVDIGAHGGDTSLPLALVARLKKMMMH